MAGLDPSSLRRSDVPTSLVPPLLCQRLKNAVLGLHPGAHWQVAHVPGATWLAQSLPRYLEQRQVPHRILPLEGSPLPVSPYRVAPPAPASGPTGAAPSWESTVGLYDIDDPDCGRLAALLVELLDAQGRTHWDAWIAAPQTRVALAFYGAVAEFQRAARRAWPGLHVGARRRIPALAAPLPLGVELPESTLAVFAALAARLRQDLAAAASGSQAAPAPLVAVLEPWLQGAALRWLAAQGIAPVVALDPALPVRPALAHGQRRCLELAPAVLACEGVDEWSELELRNLSTAVFGSTAQAGIHWLLLRGRPSDRHAPRGPLPPLPEFVVG